MPALPTSQRLLTQIKLSVSFVLACLLAACGGGGGSPAPAPSSSGDLLLLTFLQDGRDDVAPNAPLEFQFSAAIDADSISAASIQIRADGGVGPVARGRFDVDGPRVRFRPDFAGACDGSDGGLLADRGYVVTLAGVPMNDAVRALDGSRLPETSTLSFRTAATPDPLLFAGASETELRVLETTPANGSAAVTVEDGNQIAITLNKSLRPCTVDSTSVRLRMAQRGHLTRFEPTPQGNPSGFATVSGDTGDQDPTDDYSWGDAGVLPDVTTYPTPQTIPIRVRLLQRIDETRLVITPDMEGTVLSNLGRARFPENALLVVELSSAIETHDGLPLAPQRFSFTTENLPRQETSYDLDASGDTAFDRAATTADIDTARAPDRIQGFLLFSGDGDNGGNLLQPAHPATGVDCDVARQLDDGTVDHFDPDSDVLLDTGDSRNGCANGVDGSQAVVWEFKSLRIRNGVTVRVVGRNPAILLVQGDVRVDAGGRLLARGDGQGGAPDGAGEGEKAPTSTSGTAGGIGVAGGGDGGGSPSGIGELDPARYGGHGKQGYYHTGNGDLGTDVGIAGGTGGGHGNISARWNEQINPNNRNTPSGGGAGHAVEGEAGTALGTGDSPTSLDGDPDGAAGGVYGDTSGAMRLPEAGSGGGAGGELRPFESQIGRGPGGAGGAGGGFLDVTASGNMTILGTIDAAGSDGGSNAAGGINPSYAWNPGTGGGGGGSGGGIRLLTPGDITLGATTVLTVAGGQGGAGRLSHGAVSPPVNDGGDGGHGRLVIEDGNSLITGLSSASLIPGEGTAGFRRSTFDATRFQSGGLVTHAVSEPFLFGAFDPSYEAPRQVPGDRVDFDASIPAVASRGTGVASILIEVRGYPMRTDGSLDEAAVTAWHTVGWFADSGIEDMPTWHAGQPDLADIGGALPDGNDGLTGMNLLDGHEYVQVRITFFVPDTLGAHQDGPSLTRWIIRASSDH